MEKIKYSKKITKQSASKSIRLKTQAVLKSTKTPEKDSPKRTTSPYILLILSVLAKYSDEHQPLTPKDLTDKIHSEFYYMDWYDQGYIISTSAIRRLLSTFYYNFFDPQNPMLSLEMIHKNVEAFGFRLYYNDTYPRSYYVILSPQKHSFLKNPKI
ncbi:MAG: hypothetical protein E7294_03925 [Lachnospiraceae bacterium]|nr:hypothetical protein [Lachnospiraceae bacterium]